MLRHWSSLLGIFAIFIQSRDQNSNIPHLICDRGNHFLHKGDILVFVVGFIYNIYRILILASIADKKFRASTGLARLIQSRQLLAIISSRMSQWYDDIPYCEIFFSDATGIDEY